MFALAFPGQGTLRVGMGAWLRRRPAGRAILERADEVLGRPLSRTIASGPAADLVDTRNAQPAVTACNLAALAVLREEGMEASITAGHSVGEFSALVTADVLTTEEALELVQRRADLMSTVSRVGEMASVMGLPVTEVTKLADSASTSGTPLVVAIENGEQHTVVSGAGEAIDRLERALDGRAPVRRLEVSNAFHSPLMDEVRAEWGEVVDATPFREPRVPVVTNVTGAVAADADAVRRAVTAQLTGRVRWTETVEVLADAATSGCVEVGDSKALTKIARAVGHSWTTLSEPSALPRLRSKAEVGGAS